MTLFASRLPLAIQSSKLSDLGTTIPQLKASRQVCPESYKDIIFSTISLHAVRLPPLTGSPRSNKMAQHHNPDRPRLESKLANPIRLLQDDPAVRQMVSGLPSSRYADAFNSCVSSPKFLNSEVGESPLLNRLGSPVIDYKFPCMLRNRRQVMQRMRIADQKYDDQTTNPDLVVH